MVQRCRWGDANLAAVAVSKDGDELGRDKRTENSWRRTQYGDWRRHYLGLFCISIASRWQKCLPGGAIGPSFCPARSRPSRLPFRRTGRETRQPRTTFPLSTLMVSIRAIHPPSRVRARPYASPMTSQWSAARETSRARPAAPSARCLELWDASTISHSASHTSLIGVADGQ